jgi:DHA1 family bicyclomycin/chloramphenicol resistance-like MFS transporter
MEHAAHEVRERLRRGQRVLEKMLGLCRLLQPWRPWTFMPVLKSIDANAALASPQPARAVGSFPWGFALIMGALAALGPFSVDTYFPSFPAIASHFGISQLQAQSTLGFSLFAPIGTLLALELFPHRRGMASSLQGFVQIILFAAISAFVAPVVYASGLKHALAMAVMLVLNCLACTFFRLRHELRL